MILRKDKGENLWKRKAIFSLSFNPNKPIWKKTYATHWISKKFNYLFIISYLFWRAQSSKKWYLPATRCGVKEIFMIVFRAFIMSSSAHVCWWLHDLIIWYQWILSVQVWVNIVKLHDFRCFQTAAKYAAVSRGEWACLIYWISENIFKIIIFCFSFWRV